jgi:serine/threonine protein kinase
LSEKQEQPKQFKIDVESFDAAASRAVSDHVSGMVGQILADRYRVEEIVGRGGMAVVFKAHHMLMNKTVAIKVLRPNLASEGVTLQRFKNEAQAASSLDHPNVVTVHDFGVTPEGQPFLVMDFLEGKTLAETIKANGSLSLERFFEVFSQITSVLEHAHKKHVVHRDIKPSNIVIEADGKAKLLDFGIAKIVSPEGQGLDLTRTGDVFGSPLYMSPEQSNGQKVDERSDIYELGCVMYEALAGHPPFAGDNIYELIQKHAQSSPPPLSAARKSSATLNSLEAIIFRCIAKKPEHRFQSVGELGEALKQAEAQTETPLSRLSSALKLQMVRVVALAKKLEPTQPLAAAELYAGAVRFFSNEPSQWNELTERSLLLFQTYGDPLGQMTRYTAEMRARYFERVGNMAESTSLARQAFAIASLIGDRNEAIKMSVYGTYLRMMAGQVGLARQQFDTLMQNFETGKPENLCDLNEWLAPLAIKFGTKEQIELLEKRSLERVQLLESSSSAETTASRLRSLAEFQADTGHPERALVSIRQAAAALETEGALADRETLVRALSSMSLIYKMLGQKDNAEIAAQHAREVESGTFKYGRHWSP